MHWRDIVPCLPIFFFFPPQTMTLAMAIDSHETTVFRSKLPDISISNNIPLHRYCFENISEFNDKPCLITGSNGRIYSYNETHLLCHKTAAGLSKLGVKKDDPSAGEAVVAFVVRSGGAELTEDEVKEFVAKQVEVYKRPHKILFIEAIPVSPTGKILRKELRAKLASSSV
ncbi:hypothetical protein C5167_003559 [Papaver somniferum]|uniref:4-coumarate--CoA ligase n=1 Tax=Papaver somniferum TaxID=3469 RepID=A0A4Y7L1A7_PAPSO|nr:hypothetical protein C5167_003559 [Papaver somniferum]